MLSTIKITFSRRETLIMRGLSIMLIMVHNFLHLYPGVLKESEGIYYPDRINRFFEIFRSGSGLTGYDVLSFLGWYGVPVFIFLTGYGLVMRYEAPGPQWNDTKINFSASSFLLRNWLKLMNLMLLGVVIFTLLVIFANLKEGIGIDWVNIWSRLISLSGLNDIARCWIPTNPGVYWYFGLTFELYLLYAWLIKSSSNLFMWFMAIVCLVIMTSATLFGHPHLENVLRHNFTGWAIPFTLGIWVARKPTQPAWLVWTAVFISIILFLPAHLTPYTWQFTPVMAAIVIISISLIISKIKAVNRIILWIGEISAWLFVAHPIARSIMGLGNNSWNNPDNVPTLSVTLLYIALAFVTAIIYRWLTSKIFAVKK